MDRQVTETCSYNRKDFFFSLDSVFDASEKENSVSCKWTPFHYRIWCCKFYKLGVVVYWFEENGCANAMENRVIEFVVETIYLSLRDSTPASIVLHVIYMWKIRRRGRHIERYLSQQSVPLPKIIIVNFKRGLACHYVYFLNITENIWLALKTVIVKYLSSFYCLWQMNR